MCVHTFFFYLSLKGTVEPKEPFTKDRSSMLKESYNYIMNNFGKELDLEKLQLTWMTEISNMVTSVTKNIIVLDVRI